MTEQLELQGNKFTLSFSGDSYIGTSERTVGMNDDFLEDYDHKSWRGTGKIIEIKSGDELRFYFSTQTRTSHIAGVAFKRENYDKWDASLEDFIFSTHHSDAESSKSITVSNKKTWVDLLAQKLWDQKKTFTTPALECKFEPILINELVQKGIIAELETQQIQTPLTA